MVIDTWENGQYKEIWVYSEETDDDERAMCGLINGDWGWLNYYNEECDAGLSSRNPNYTGTDDETMNFIINGELDPYPLSCVLPAEQVMKALEYFEKYHKLPTFITWHDDNSAQKFQFIEQITERKSGLMEGTMGYKDYIAGLMGSAPLIYMRILQGRNDK